MIDLLAIALQDTPIADPSAAPAGSGGWSTMLIYGVGMIAIFYFMLIRPQKRETERREKMLSALKKHDVVVTHSGLIGQIAEISDDLVTLKVDDNQNVRIRFRRAAIAGPLESSADKEAAAKRESTDGKSEAAESRAAGRAAR